MDAPAKLRVALLRGSMRRCPHCGRGALYKSRWRLTMHDRCAACGYRYLRNQGDPWIFMLFVDRAVFIFPIVLALYFRMYEHLITFAIFASSTIALLILTTPHRYGVCVALDYVTRMYWERPGDR